MLVSYTMSSLKVKWAKSLISSVLRMKRRAINSAQIFFNVTTIPLLKSWATANMWALMIWTWKSLVFWIISWRRGQRGLMPRVSLSSSVTIASWKVLIFSTKMINVKQSFRRSFLSRLLKNLKRISLKLKMKGGRKVNSISQNSDQLSRQKQNLLLERNLLVKVLHKRSKKKSASS